MGGTTNDVHPMEASGHKCVRFKTWLMQNVPQYRLSMFRPVAGLVPGHGNTAIFLTGICKSVNVHLSNNHFD